MDQSGCRVPFPDDQLQRVLSPKTLDLLLRIRQKKDLEDAKIGGLEHCPFCDFACIIVDDGPTFLCQKSECMAVSCRKCWRREHMGKTCEDVAQQEKSVQGDHAVAEAMSECLFTSGSRPRLIVNRSNGIDSGLSEMQDPVYERSWRKSRYLKCVPAMSYHREF
jgi:TRIAD3 protein (E3 ubiquitin-protein ligase RNF216)